MPHLFTTFLISAAGLLMVTCKPARSTLKVSDLPDYNRQSKDHVLFLNFLVTGNARENVQARLASAHAGDGRMKQLPSSMHSPYRIIAVSRHSVSAIERELVFEHPLARAAEVSDVSGQIRKVEVRETEAPLLIRIQQDPGLNGLDLFSVTPEKGRVKIYTLHIK